MKRPAILAINPGSTSTKVALFRGPEEVWSDTQRYDAGRIREFPSIPAQEQFRLDEIHRALGERGTKTAELDAVVGRGGLLRPIPGGTYEAVSYTHLDVYKRQGMGMAILDPAAEAASLSRWGVRAMGLPP